MLCDTPVNRDRMIAVLGCLLIVSSAVSVAAPVSTLSKKPWKEVVFATHKGVAASGQNAIVVQVEANGPSASGVRSVLHFAPDLDSPKLSGVTIHVAAGAKESVHSTTVAELLYGPQRSIAQGIKQAYVFEAGAWITMLDRWDLNPAHAGSVFPGPTVNHSWVASVSASRNARLLRQLDYSAISNNILHVYGVRQKGSGEPLFASAFNGISVGGGKQNIDQAYPAIDDLYTGGRYRPELVGPYGAPSAGVPIVAAAAVRLNAQARQQGLKPMVASRAGSEQLPVELVKALLMAGASGDFVYFDKDQPLVNSFAAMGLTPNGLDQRYGMGMLNVAASEQILASGMVPSLEDSGDQATPRQSSGGFHFDAAFGGDKANNTGTYYFSPDNDSELSASLVWLANIAVDQTQGTAPALNGTVFNLDLCLQDVTDEVVVIAESKGIQDASEHLRVRLQAGHRYRLLVLNGSPAATSWPYALAWRVKSPGARF